MYSSDAGILFVSNEEMWLTLLAEILFPDSEGICKITDGSQVPVVQDSSTKGDLRFCHQYVLDNGVNSFEEDNGFNKP